MTKAIIFDLFGVIRPDSLTATWRYFGGDPVADTQFIQETLDAANNGTIPKARVVFAEHFNVTPEEWMSVLERGVENDQQLLDYILELRVHYKIALLTNISRGRLYNYFTTEELTKYLDVVIESCEIGCTKPDRRAYEVTAEQLDVRTTECVMVDDREEYCAGAQAVGMQAVLYQSFPQFKQKLAAILNR